MKSRYFNLFISILFFLVLFVDSKYHFISVIYAHMILKDETVQWVHGLYVPYCLIKNLLCPSGTERRMVASFLWFWFLNWWCLNEWHFTVAKEIKLALLVVLLAFTILLSKAIISECIEVKNEY